MKKPTIKLEDHSISAALASSIASLEYSQPTPPSRSSQSQSIVPSKKTGRIYFENKITHCLCFQILVETYNFLRSKQGRQAIYSGKRTTRTTIPSLQDLCVETLKDNVDGKYSSNIKKSIFILFYIVVCRTYFNRLPYDVVKPILDSATPEQLHLIIDHNPVDIIFYVLYLIIFFICLKDYVDDAEPLWQHFCSIHFKDAQRDECESYFELYWVIEMQNLFI